MRGKVVLLGMAILSAALAGGRAAPADAQTLLLTLDNPDAQTKAVFGYSLTAGDVNGDGKADIVVGAPYFNVSCNTGRAYVFSGADGSLLYTLGSPNQRSGAKFGKSVAAGDVNGDGKGDVVVGVSGEDLCSSKVQGQAYVFSGADGSLLYTLGAPNPQVNTHFGDSVVVGDVNGDGKADIAVAASAGTVGENVWQGQVYIFSGVDGSLLFTLDAPTPQPLAFFGQSLGVGDVNGDGKADVAVGASGKDVGGNKGQGQAYVFSGADGSLLFTLDSPDLQAGAHFGASMAVADVNGDDKGDVAVGASWGDVSGHRGEGRVYVFSGANGSLLFALSTPSSSEGGDFGWSVAAGDVNGDGKGDIAIGAYSEDVGANFLQGQTYVFSGADGSLLYTLDTPDPQVGASFGRTVAVGDIDGDGKGSVIVGAPLESVGGNTEQGRVYVFAGAGDGIAELSELEDSAPESSGSSARNTLAIGGAIAGGALLLAVGAWGVRRRRARSLRG